MGKGMAWGGLRVRGVVGGSGVAGASAAHPFARRRGEAGARGGGGGAPPVAPAGAGGLFPPLDPGLAAVHVSGGARVDGRRVRASLLYAARRRGAQLRTGTAELAAGGVRADGELLGA